MEAVSFHASSKQSIYILRFPKAIPRQDAWKAMVGPLLPQGTMRAAFKKEFAYLPTEEQEDCLRQNAPAAARIRDECALEVKPKQVKSTHVC